jgi:ADP-ribose pyrophosphatase YjhB (NUDIX family)
VKFCGQCGASVTLKVPVDDNRQRHVCDVCETIHYINPKVIVGCLPTVSDKILLCKRAIEPRYGKWTLPAGFMENGETSADGAARETWEEAAAKAVNLVLYRIFDVPHISQVYLFYRCGIENDEFGVGPESLESALFSEEEIPWDELAFPTVRELLKEFLTDRQTGEYPVRNTVIDYPRR